MPATGAIHPIKDAPLARRAAAGRSPVLEKPRPQGKLAAMEIMARTAPFSRKRRRNPYPFTTISSPPSKGRVMVIRPFAGSFTKAKKAS
jgi:hypothetical protein